MSYVTLTKTGRALRLTLTPEGREELQARVDAGQSIDTDTTLYDLLEDHLCNGWDWIRPEEIGALTSAPILSDECSRNDEGEITSIGAVYWHERYQIESATNELLTTGHMTSPPAPPNNLKPERNTPCPTKPFTRRPSPKCSTRRCGSGRPSSRP